MSSTPSSPSSPPWPSATAPNLARMPGPRTLLRVGLELARLPRRLAELEHRLGLLEGARRPAHRTSLAGDPRRHGTPLELFDRATR